ncbi:MAG: aspartyl-phosphate phosphatase Spo0E family protein [Desulfosporosinus sp.]|nr:aspartyl-phosphate phosphatase Spo0E family protein [Desulfosporosinus sp.]
MDINNLLTEIAVYRCKMNRVAKGKSLTDPYVIRLCKGVDVLIYKYLKARHQQNVVLQMPDQDRQRAEVV